MAINILELLDFAQSRRGYVRGSMNNGTGLSVGNTQALASVYAQALTDNDILQFALTLEHLEDTMYREMLAANILTGKELTYFQNFGAAEAAHVKALTDTLNSLGQTPNAELDDYAFPAFDSRMAILNFAKTAEDIGVGAYQGAAAAITNKDILAAAGSIVQVEARHAAIVNLLLGQTPVPAATTSSLTVEQVLAKVNPILGQ